MTQFTLPLPIKEIESIVDAIEVVDNSTPLFINWSQKFAFLILPEVTVYEGLTTERSYTVDHIVKALLPYNKSLAEFVKSRSGLLGNTEAYVFMRVSFDRMPGRMRHLLICDICNNLLHPEEAHKQEFDEQDLWLIHQFEAEADARKLATFMKLLVNGNHTVMADKVRKNMALMLEALDR